MNTIQKIAVVQAYINHIKGVTVSISHPRTLKQFVLLDKAHSAAQRYFRDNGGSIHTMF